jgi:hypothetical protein
MPRTPSPASAITAASLLLTAGARAPAQGHAAPVAPSPDEVRALVAEMLRDAEQRTTLLHGDGRAGHDGRRFFLSSGDGRFRLDVRGQIQFRYMVNFHDDPSDGEADTETGFQTRRTKLFFEGVAFDPSISYQVVGAFSRSTGTPVLEFAWVSKELSDGVSIMAGQFKAPFLREWLVSGASLLAVERSFVSEAFNAGFVQGAQATFTAEPVRVMLAFTDGARSQNSEWNQPKRATRAGLINNPSGAGASDYALTARAELLLAGERRRFSDFTSTAGSPFGAMLGFAGRLEGGDGSASAFSRGRYLYGAWTADLSLEGDGWNAFIAGMGGHADYHGADLGPGGMFPPGDISFSDYGLVAQAGVMIPGTAVEPFARYEALFPDGGRGGAAGADDTFHAVTAGFNWYLHGHAAKFTADLVWTLDGPSPVVGPRTGHGLLAADGERAVRLQFQLLF